MERRLSVHKVSDWWAKYDEIVAKLTCLVTYNGSAWEIKSDCFPEDFEQIKKDVTALGFRDITQFCESFPTKFLVNPETGANQTNENPEGSTPKLTQSTDAQMPNIDDETRALLANYNPVPPSMRGEEEKKTEMESSSMPPPIFEKKSDCVHFKFSHAEKTRRFAFPRDDQNLIGSVKGRVEKIVEKKEPNLFWRDEDSLCVLENRDDMEAAIDYADHQRTPACVLIEATGGKEEEAKEEVKEDKKEEAAPAKPLTQQDSSSAFNGFAFVCDGCDAYLCPETGGRFKCLVCVDFDLCLECVARGTHSNHALVRLLNQETIIPARDGDGNVIHVQLKETQRCTPFFVAERSDVKKPKEAFDEIKANADEAKRRADVLAEKKRKLAALREEKKKTYRANLMAHAEDMHELRRAGHGEDVEDDKREVRRMRDEKKREYRANLMEHAEEMNELRRAMDIEEDQRELSREREERKKAYRANLMEHAEEMDEIRREYQETIEDRRELSRKREELKKAYRANLMERPERHVLSREEPRRQGPMPDRRAHFTTEMLDDLLRECGVPVETRARDEQRIARQREAEMEREREQEKRREVVQKMEMAEREMIEKEGKRMEDEKVRKMKDELLEKVKREEEEKRKARDDLKKEEEKRAEKWKEEKLRMMEVELEEERKLRDALALEEEMLRETMQRDLEEKELRAEERKLEEERLKIEAEEKEMLEEQRRIIEELAMLEEMKNEEDRILKLREDEAKLAELEAQLAIERELLAKQKEEEQKQKNAQALEDEKKKMLEEDTRMAAELDDLFRKQAEKERIDFFRKNPDYPAPLDIAAQVAEPEKLNFYDFARRIEEVQEQKKALVNMRCKRMEEGKGKYDEFEEMERQEWERELSEAMMDDEQEEEDVVNVEDENLKVKVEPHHQVVLEALKQVEIDMSEEEVDVSVEEENLKERAAEEVERLRAETDKLIMEALFSAMLEEEKEKPRHVEIDMNEDSDGFSDDAELEELKKLHREVTESLNQAESVYGTPFSGLEQKDDEIEVREKDEEEQKKEEEYDRLSDASGSPVHSIEMVEAEDATEEKKNEKNDLWNAYESWKEEAKKEEKGRRESSSIGSDIEIIDKLIEESDSVLETMHVLESKFDQLLLQPLVETSTSSSTTSSAAPESSTSSLHFPSVPTTTPTVSSSASSSSMVVPSTPAPSTLPYPGVVVYLPTAPLQPAPAQPAPVPSAPVEEPVDPIPQTSHRRHRQHLLNAEENWTTNELGEDVPTSSSNQWRFYKMGFEDADIENIVLFLEHKIAVELHQMPSYLDVPSRIQRYCNTVALRGYQEHAPIINDGRVMDDRMISRIGLLIENRLNAMKSALYKSDCGMDNTLWSFVCTLRAQISHFSYDDSQKYRNVSDELYNLLIKDDTEDVLRFQNTTSQVAGRPVQTRAWSEKVELNEKQQKMLTELFDSDIFSNEHYERMVEVCLTARDLEQAIDMMLSYEW